MGGMGGMMYLKWTWEHARFARVQCGSFRLSLMVGRFSAISTTRIKSRAFLLRQTIKNKIDQPYHSPGPDLGYCWNGEKGPYQTQGLELLANEYRFELPFEARSVKMAYIVDTIIYLKTLSSYLQTAWEHDSAEKEPFFRRIWLIL